MTNANEICLRFEALKLCFVPLKPMRFEREPESPAHGSVILLASWHLGAYLGVTALALSNGLDTDLQYQHLFIEHVRRRIRRASR